MKYLTVYSSHLDPRIKAWLSDRLKVSFRLKRYLVKSWSQLDITVVDTCFGNEEIEASSVLIGFTVSEIVTTHHD